MSKHEDDLDPLEAAYYEQRDIIDRLVSALRRATNNIECTEWSPGRDDVLEEARAALKLADS